MKKTILLGMINNTIFTGDIEITTRNRCKEFTCSFNEGTMFDTEEISDSYYKDYFENYWDSIDDTEKINLLEDGDITKEEVFNNWKHDIYDYHDIIDCSCTDYEMYINDIIVNFETDGCGQLDVRERCDFDKMKFTDKKNVMELLKLWDQYHCKKIDTDTENKINNIINNLTRYEEYEEGFENFIKDNITL